MFSDPEKFVALWRADWLTAVGILVAACMLIFLGAFLKKLAEHAVGPFLQTASETATALRGVWRWALIAIFAVSIIFFLSVNRNPCSRLTSESSIKEVFQCQGRSG